MPKYLSLRIRSCFFRSRNLCIAPIRPPGFRQNIWLPQAVQKGKAQHGWQVVATSLKGPSQNWLCLEMSYKWASSDTILYPSSGNFHRKNGESCHQEIGVRQTKNDEVRNHLEHYCSYVQFAAQHAPRNTQLKNHVVQLINLSHHWTHFIKH